MATELSSPFFSCFSQEQQQQRQLTPTSVQLGKKLANILAVGKSDGGIEVYKIDSSATPLRSLVGLPSPVEVVNFDVPEGLVAGGCVEAEEGSLKRRGVAKVWDLEQGKVVRTLTTKKKKTDNNVNFTDLLFHPRLDVLLAGTTTTTTLFDLRQRKEIISLPQSNFGCVRFSPCGRWVISGDRGKVEGEEGGLKIWDVRMTKVLKTFG
eukprot:CAMPEP_0201507232 /NCGR_PEP_ID=MMETSP0161_2-20130828/952_1 /ASSEMBLY_ACC=CAM_ASM_000251 /TAXON_ID=180227 /ORGANISM="Neoparamoeba aestuarina, Strain SoJaBio B1-5/56/2" /LENGTH=207 /DNA_ID=CAMNT_0047901537 /DNA_START=76 /DNA_END=696 /DNA_ORIENTATION=+